MLLPIQQLRYVQSIAHEGKVVVFATVESQDTDLGTRAPFTFGKIYYTVRQDGFEDNNDKTAMVGWKHWTLLPFIDEKPDPSVADREAENRFLIRSLYTRTASIGSVGQVQAVSHNGHLYVFRVHRDNGHLLVNRYILNGLTNELLPGLEVRYKRSRQRYKANANMKIVNGKLQGVDSLDFRDANDTPFLEPTRQLSFLTNRDGRQFAAMVLPTTDKETFRWHFFLQQHHPDLGNYLQATAIRSDANGQFILDDQLVIDPVAREGDTPVVRSLPGLTNRRWLLHWDRQLGEGLAATAFNIQVEQATKSGPQLLKGDTKVLLTFNTADAQIGALSFGVSTDGLLALVSPQSDGVEELRPATRKNIFLPLNHLEQVRAVGRVEELPKGSIIRMERGDEDRIILHTDAPHGLTHFDQVTVRNTQNYNGNYRVVQLGPNTFSIQQQWADAELGEWEFVPADATTGLAYEGLITGISRENGQLVFTTALDHGLQTDMEALIKNHAALLGDFEVTPLSDTSFALSTTWEPFEVVNLFLEASKRKGVVFDGFGEAIRVADVPVSAPERRMPFAHTLSCWVKLFPLKQRQRQVLIGDENAVAQLYIDQGKPHFCLSLPEGIYTCSGTDELPTDTWLNLTATVERTAPFAAPLLALYLNGERLAAPTALREHPYYAFDRLTDQGYTFDGSDSYANFVLTHDQHPGSGFTLEMWIKPDTLNANQTLWHKDDKTNGVFTLLRGGRLRLAFGTYNRDGQTASNTLESENALLAKTWNYVAVTVDFADQKTPQVQFIVNDTIEAPTPLPQAQGLRWEDGLHMLGKSPFRIGKKTPYYKGQMAAFRIWKGIRQPLDLLGSKWLPQPEGLKEMLVDQFTWPDYAFDPDGEGGDWPAPGEIVLHPSIVRSDTPQWQLHGGMEQALELYLSYQHVPWRGQFHLGGWAPASALRCRHGQHLTLPKGKSLQLDVNHQSFTCEVWVKTATGGGLWQFAADDDQASVLSLRLTDGLLLLNLGPRDGVQPIPMPQLFDDQWHLLTLRFDRSYTQSDDAIVWLSVDGQDAGFALANGSADLSGKLFLIGNAPDVLDTEADIQLRDLTFWDYLRSPGQVAAALHHRPAGTEYGLVAHWPLDTTDGDDKGKKRYQLEAISAPTTAPCPTRLGAEADESLAGILAEVRIWDTAQTQAAIRQTLFLPLDGQEYGLAGYWRLGAVWEEERRVTDFSAFGNDGQLFGDLYLSPDTLPRRIGAAATSPLAIAYRNDDLVAVSERAVYEASFEYRLLRTDNKPITTATVLKNAFGFALRGKAGRSALEWIEHEVFAPQIVGEVIGMPVSNTTRTTDKDYGWYKATCRFVVPDGVRLFRVLGLQNVTGDWERMEVRKHLLTHISDAVSRVTYTDSLQTLETLVGDIPNPDEHTATQQMNAQMVVAKRKRVSQLDELIRLVQGEANALAQQLTRAQQGMSMAQQILAQRQQQYNALANNPYNYYWRIKASHSGKYLALPRTGLRPMTLKAANNNISISYAPGSEVTQQSIPQAHQMDFVIERISNSQFRLRVGNSSYYLAGFREITTKILFVNQSIHPKGTTFGVVERQQLDSGFNFDAGVIHISIGAVFASSFQAFWNVGLVPILDQKNLQEARNLASRAFRINVEGTGLAMDITGSQQGDGAQCLQWTYNSPASANQFFIFAPCNGL